MTALVRLRAHMFEAMGIVENSHEWQDNAREWFTNKVTDQSYGIFVLEVDGEVVACAMGGMRDVAPSPAVPDGGDAVISNVCTDAAHRGHGYGRTVFDAVMSWARQMGVARVELMATPSGQSIYERAGFSVVRFPAMRASLR
ncbi:GNAT family N-acetyltransferase [Microbacterium sp. BH-3-3-3]|uniref:GNAT family N-acetyltransferase n=1 Tax=Microbacterium sp. BH-3-3-3 TaxID=1906742 RepID=UPI001C92D170